MIVRNAFGFVPATITLEMQTKTGHK